MHRSTQSILQRAKSWASILGIVSVFGVLTEAAPAWAWEPLARGVQYRRLATPRVQAFRLDLQRVRLRAVLAKESEPSRARTDVRSLASGKEALLAVNGGFFDPRGRNLGLLVDEGRRKNPVRRADWGIFTVSKKGRARLVHTRAYRASSATDFAIQAGPRLVVSGKTLHFPAQSARRTALGIERDGRHVVLVIAERAILTAALARLMRDDFHCRFALNLDGGSSTQLWSPFASVRRVTGLGVANGVVVVPR